MAVILSPSFCSKCGGSLSANHWNTADLTICPACKTKLQIFVFPSLFRKIEGAQAGEIVSGEQEASCFYHPQKKAVVPCDGCGAFLCALCDVPFDNQHLCPRCLEKGKEKGKFKKLENQRVLYDDIAVTLAIFPMILFWLTCLTAPATLFVAIRYWKAPSSVIPRGKFRMILAMVIASLQILGWIFGIAYFATRGR